MVIREPKCIQWKRRGAELVVRQLSGLTAEQELIFWQEHTKQLKLLQIEMLNLHKQPTIIPKY